MSRITQARELIRRAALPDGLRAFGQQDVGRYAIDEARLLYYDGDGTRFLATELTPDVLAQSLHYTIRLNTRAIPDESAVPLGSSKHRGLPHLPPGFAWPHGMYFAAQFNLAELRPYDVYDVFPDSGMLYVFMDMADGVRVVHHDGPLDALRVTPYPDPDTIPTAEYYLDDFIKKAGLITFIPQALFYVGGDVYNLSAATALIPRELRDEVAAVLGAPVVTRDTDRRIFGRPTYWQGEDEGYWPRQARHLLLQDDVDDATVHVWISEKDARRRDYSRCWLDSSGT
jgi:uncharacterized protein DUF1963